MKIKQSNKPVTSEEIVREHEARSKKHLELSEVESGSISKYIAKLIKTNPKQRYDHIWLRYGKYDKDTSMLADLIDFDKLFLAPGHLFISYVMGGISAYPPKTIQEVIDLNSLLEIKHKLKKYFSIKVFLDQTDSMESKKFNRRKQTRTIGLKLQKKVGRNRKLETKKGNTGNKSNIA